MSKRCELTGISPLKGHNVSHAKNKTKRRFNINIHSVTLNSTTLGERFKVKIAASTMRTLNKLGGLERFLLASDNSKLSNEAIKIKNKLSKKLSPNK